MVDYFFVLSECNIGGLCVNYESCNAEFLKQFVGVAVDGSSMFQPTFCAINEDMKYSCIASGF